MSHERLRSYGFRPMTREDYPMFRDWLAQPHIGGWWSDGATELRLIEEEMDSPTVDMRIVTHQGQPFAFVQDYNAHAFDAPQYADQPPQARALDMFLGDPAFLGQGHASGFLRQRAAELAADDGLVLVDPDPANTRAIATYQSAGFVPLGIRPCEDGDPVQILRYPG